MKFILGGLLSILVFASCSPVKFNVDNAKVTPSSCTGATCVYVWKTDAVWSNCSQACGSGTQTRAVTCVDTNQNIVPDSNCTVAKPMAVENCNTQACNSNGADWNLGQWGACSASCGGGTQNRTVVCQSNQTVLDDSQCSATKPVLSQTCNTQACSGNLVNHTTTQTVPAGGNQVDILIIIDDSSSMVQDNAKLGARLSGFVTSLQSANIDWQMCITTTDVSYFQGRPIQWSGTTTRVINKNTPNLASVFSQTIADNSIGGSNDERGIMAAVESIENNANVKYQCYRHDAAAAFIVISDEDERSVGGNATLSATQYKALETKDYPATLLSTISTTFNSTTFTKKVAFNSIVVKDNTCQTIENGQGTPSFIGTYYMQLAQMTNGYSGSICDTDYSTNLNFFSSGIGQTLSQITLDCVPAGATPTVTPSSYPYTISGNIITFNPVLPQGSAVTINYQCVQ